MDDMELLVDLHRPGARQGPGGDAETRRAVDLAGLDRSRPLAVADIGCGTGAASLVLARVLEARITAVDLLPSFLDELQARARGQGVAERIIPLNASMADLPFAGEAFDVIWSEGAIYNMGFEAGISAWRRFLKPGGKLVVSEITWLGLRRPAELQAHWQQEYPEIDLASAKVALLERHGFAPEAYFVLPDHCWVENYHQPMRDRFDAFLQRHGHSDRARAIVAAEEREMSLYARYHQHFGYGVYVARRLPD